MRTCPTCGKSVEWRDNPWRPFCSERCKLIDFGKWANEDYRVPGGPIGEGVGSSKRGAEAPEDEDPS